jgi:putative ABC transport system ATP-binding protein
MPPLIETVGLERHFHLPDGTVKAVDGISISVAAGEFLAVMGPSGSGKSTLLYVLGAMDQATAGRISVAGHPLNEMTDTQRSRFRNASLGFVFQSFHLLSRLTLARNVELPMMYAGVSPEARRNRSRALLKALGILDRAERYPTETSGGQCQRAAIARALVNRPELIFADEPTGNLDSRTGLEVIAIFQALNRLGRTIVMVTHDENMARHASRVLRMHDGKLISDLAVTGRLTAVPPPDLDLSLTEAVHAHS